MRRPYHPKGDVMSITRTTNVLSSRRCSTLFRQLLVPGKMSTFLLAKTLSVSSLQ